MSTYCDRQLYCCNGAELFLIDIEQARVDSHARLWRWVPADSPEIPADPNHKFWFVGIDECKPVLGGSALLLTSSWGPGGVALIRKTDKKCLFYAEGANAHSAELIENKVIAAAFSDRCDRLRLYDLSGNVLAAQPAWEMEFKHGHGVVWDRQRQVLWALGREYLLKLSVKLEAPLSAKVLQSWTLPQPSGHDLFPIGEAQLAVTHDRGACRFDIHSGSLLPMPGLEQAQHLKSLSAHPRTGELTYTQGEPIFSHTIHFAKTPAIELPPMNLYKVRWNAHNTFSYAE